MNLTNQGYIFVGQDGSDNPPEKSRTDMATSCVDIDGGGSENYSYGTYSGGAVQLRLRQSFGPTSNEQGFAGNICWGIDPDTGQWTLFIKVQNGKVGRDDKGQWFKVGLIQHR